MAERSYAVLEERGVLEVAGADCRAFLQGLVSNDVMKATEDRAIHAALLTPQGKYLHDFFIIAQGEALLLETEAARLDELRRRLAVYKLRSRITVNDATHRFFVAVAFGGDALAALGVGAEPGQAAPFADGVAYVDPRLAAMGARVLLPRDPGAAPLERAGLARQDAASYDRLRLGLGVPDGSRDLPIYKAILLEAGFDELNGIDWQKGCYMGQELTARTKYRALIRRRLMPVTIEGVVPQPGTTITFDGQEVGEMRSGRDGIGLALLRLDAAAEDGKPLLADGARLRPRRPVWAKF